MNGTQQNPKPVSPKSRVLSNTEHVWCRAVSSGTGITILGLQMAKPATEINLLRNVLNKLQDSHPILRYKLHYDPTSKQFSFIPSASPQANIKVHDLSSTVTLRHSLKNKENSHLSPFHLILEHEMNINKWSDPKSFPCNEVELFFASVYALSDKQSIVVLRFHTAVCDRTTAISLLRELMELNKVVEKGGEQKGIKNDEEGQFGIEDVMPKGVAKKTLWAHGMDMLGYSVNSLRLTNLKFKNAKLPRCSEIVRLQMHTILTDRILTGCKSRGIKLCGALAAAGLIAVRSSSCNADQQKKYGVVTLTDCRSVLEPPLSSHCFGFYHSAVLNIHTVKGSESFWDLAKRNYLCFAESKKLNKHLADIADINFLMCKAIENPSLTASSSLRTSFISVFEEPVFDDTLELRKELGVEDYMGCASLHGVGPSIAIFDTIRDGELDCACVYPSPLHSKEQMTELVDRMKCVLIEGSKCA